MCDGSVQAISYNVDPVDSLEIRQSQRRAKRAVALSDRLTAFSGEYSAINVGNAAWLPAAST